MQKLGGWGLATCRKGNRTAVNWWVTRQICKHNIACLITVAECPSVNLLKEHNQLKHTVSMFAQLLPSTGVIQRRCLKMKVQLLTTTPASMFATVQGSQTTCRSTIQEAFQSVVWLTSCFSSLGSSHAVSSSASGSFSRMYHLLARQNAISQRAMRARHDLLPRGTSANICSIAQHSTA